MWGGQPTGRVRQQIPPSESCSQVQGFGAYYNANIPEKLESGPKITQLESEKALSKALLDSSVLTSNSVDERQSNEVVRSMGHEFKSHHSVTLGRFLGVSVLQLSPL